MAGRIRERDLMLDARLWANWADYRPLLEFAKYCGLSAIAANAPRRYVGAAGRGDEGILSGNSWPAASYTLLPPLPLPSPSPAYLQHLREDAAVVRTDQIFDTPAETAADKPSDSSDSSDKLSDSSERGSEHGLGAGRCPYIGLEARDGLVQPMLLWDATMAHSISRALEAEADRLVVHVCEASPEPEPKP